MATEWVKAIRELLLIDYGGKCCKCGSMEDLEFAHTEETELSGRGRGSYARVYDILTHPNSYILLCHKCHKCHKAYDDGDLLLLPAVKLYSNITIPLGVGRVVKPMEVVAI